MVDGINAYTPLLSGASEARDAVAKKVVASGTIPEKQTVKEAKQVKDNNTTENVSSAITEAAGRRLDALTTANVSDYLKAAEKLIDASLPNKPPGTKLRINLDEGAGRFVYQGIDTNTGDVVTQFPADEVLKYLSYIREREGLEGIVVDKEV